MKLTATHATIIAVSLVAALVVLIVTGKATVEQMLPIITGIVGVMLPSPREILK